MPESNNKRIAKNTLVLYVRTIIVMAITLYSSRVVLSSLGVTDFGIYNAVGGFVMFFMLLSSSLSAAISRYITFELGKGDIERLKIIFSVSRITMVALAVIILILIEGLGVWFLNSQMNIPTERLFAANWVFQLSVASFIFNLLYVPYEASIVAHEHMRAYAYVSILNAVLLLVAAVITEYIPFDKLIFYSFGVFVVAFFIRNIYIFYGKKQFEECRAKWLFEKKIFNEIFNFAGWNFIGASSSILRDHGVNILINIFNGPTVNAARGIAMQISTALNRMVGSFTTALNPQITKSYAVNKKDEWLGLVFWGAKFSFFLMFLFSLPIFLESGIILEIWLGNVPEHTIVFVRLVLVYILLESISNSMIVLMLATGEIKTYQILVGGTQMLNFPLSLIALKIGFPPESTFWISIIVCIMCLVVRLIMLRRMINFPVSSFVKEVLMRDLFVSIFSLPIPCIIIYTFNSGYLRLLLITIVSIMSCVFSIFFIGCKRKERNIIVNKIKSLIVKPIF